MTAPERQSCSGCGGFTPLRCDDHRTLMTLRGDVRLRRKIRRFEREGCPCQRRPYRLEAGGAVALPQHEAGLDVVALVGTLRHRDHRPVPEIHGALRRAFGDLAAP